jgi:dipeptidase E
MGDTSRLGACVLSADLQPLVAVDGIDAPTELVTSGLGILDRLFIPHVRSPGNPDTAMFDRLVVEIELAGLPCWAVSDAQALCIDGATTTLLGPTPVSPH